MQHDATFENHASQRRRFALLDAMILVAATAVGLAVARWCQSEVYRPAELWIDFGSALLAAWTWTGLLFLMRHPRPTLRRLILRPGGAACIASALATSISVLLCLLGLAKCLVFGGTFRFVEFFVVCAIASAPAILASWLTIALSGLWCSKTDWIEWLGRLLAGSWILLFASVAFLL
jgi:hypothetical protein